MAKEPTKKAVKRAAAKKTAAPVKVAAKKVAAKKAAAEVKAPAPVEVKAAAPAPAKKAVVKKVAAKKVAAKKVAAKAAAKVTTVIAKIDAGFGNELFIRGSAGGLSWDAGTLMKNVSTDEWVWQSESVSDEVEFKILINDSQWSIGPNAIAFSGTTLVIEPLF